MVMMMMMTMVLIVSGLRETISVLYYSLGENGANVISSVYRVLLAKTQQRRR